MVRYNEKGIKKGKQQLQFKQELSSHLKVGIIEGPPHLFKDRAWAPSTLLACCGEIHFHSQSASVLWILSQMIFFIILIEHDFKDGYFVFQHRVLLPCKFPGLLLVDLCNDRVVTR